MPRLSASDREIRRSRGIAIWHLWPFAMMVLALSILYFDGSLLLRCVGHPVNISGGNRYAGFARLIGAVGCSIFDFRRDGPTEYLAFAIFFASIPFAVLQVLCMRRHRAYWDVVRAREKSKRAE